MGDAARSLDALLASGALAFIAGFADASSFVGADGVFCAHVTGNFVVLAADLARHADKGEWLKLATFPIFVASVLAATAYSRRPASGGADAVVSRLLTLQASLLVVAATVGVNSVSSRPGAARVVIVGLLVTSMGIQNALHRVRPKLGVMTTVMTGNVTSWLSGLLMPAVPTDAPKRRALGIVIALFGLGCVGGAYSVALLGFGALVVPAAVALFARSRAASLP